MSSFIYTHNSALVALDNFGSTVLDAPVTLWHFGNLTETQFSGNLEEKQIWTSASALRELLVFSG